jgi:5-methylthioribose kinase
MTYYELNQEQVCSYLIQAGVFIPEADLEVNEVGDGNLNFVYRARDAKTGKSVIVKQAPPYIRVIGESWPLTTDRMRIEADALEIQNRFAPGLVPGLIHRDSEMALEVIEDLSHLAVMRYGTIRMKRYPRFADHISTFMANMAFYTSDLYLSSREKKLLVKQFINPELCKLVEDFTFTDPYYDCSNNIINPELRPYLEKVFWRKTDLRLEASKLRYKYLTEAESLLHGDLHTGSILANEHETRVFDSEFAFVGPSAFDVGVLVGNILINYVSWIGKSYSEVEIRRYRDFLLDMINEICLLYEQKFRAHWDLDARDIVASIPGFQDFYFAKSFPDVVGYAAIVMIRRMHGIAHNVDVDEIEDLERRRDVQIAVLELAEEIMLTRKEFTEIHELTELVKRRLY